MTSCFTHRLRRWEAALLLAFGITLTLGVWASASESALAGQVLRHTSHALGNGHAVVVQNDNHGLSAVPRVGQTLIGQSAGEGPVSQQRQDMVILML